MGAWIRLGVAVRRALRQGADCILIGAAMWSAVAAAAGAQTAPAAPADERRYTAEDRAQLTDALDKTKQALDLYAQGRYAEAIALAEEALTIHRAVLGEQHPDYAVSLMNVAELYRSAGDYVRAEPLLREASEILKAALGDQHARYAMSLNNLALLYHSMGDFARAEPLFLQAVEIHKGALGEQHADYATSLNNLAALYYSMGDAARAEPLFRQAIEIRKSALGKQHPDYAVSLNNLAELYRSAGDYARAAPLYREASEILKAVLGDQHATYATSLNNLAELYRAMGDVARAEPLFRQALEIRKIALGDQHADYATSLNNLAMLYHSTGDYARAEPLYREAIEIDRVALSEQHPGFAIDVNNLAEVYVAMGDYARAEPLCRQALEIRRTALGEHHPDYAMSLNNLAGLYFLMHKYELAEPLYRQALEINNSALGEQHPAYAMSLNNLAQLYFVMGDDARAEPLYRQALTIASGLVDEAAIVQDEQGQLAHGRSVKFYLDNYLSFLMRRGGGDVAAYRSVLNWKGATLVRQRAGRLAAGNSEIAPLLAELQSVVREWSALAAETQQVDAAWRDRFEALSRRKEELGAELTRRSAAFRDAAAVDAAALQAALSADAALVDYYEITFKETLADASDQADLRRFIVAFVVRPGGEVRLFDLGEMEPIEAAIEQWRASFGASAEAQAAGALLRERLWAPLEEAIGDASLVLVSPDGALGKLPFAALPGRKPGTYLIEDVSLALVPVPRLIPELVRTERAAEELDRELLLVGGVDYDQREGDRGAPRWSDEELSAVARIRGTARETAEGLRWGALPGTSGEAAAIGGLFSVGDGGGAGVMVLEGAAATEERFRALAPTSRILHVATHGFFAPEGRRSTLAAEEPEEGALISPRIDGIGLSERLSYGEFPPGLLSGIVLAGANDPPALPDDPAAFADLPEDGILTAEELAFLRLGGVELAVLSACETGLGKVAGGEGLLGIQRAFQISGVRTTVATLWKVDDAMTQRLMTTFYRNVLEGGQSHLDALRNAQLEMLRMSPDQAVEILEGDGGLRAAELAGPAGPTAPARISPRFWAAFTLSGDWR
jgi:CHAT domain-containing protein/tetratricopeptide (TPR) repeat protein